MIAVFPSLVQEQLTYCSITTLYSVAKLFDGGCYYHVGGENNPIFLTVVQGDEFLCCGCK